jgi:hypothetical protein
MKLFHVSARTPGIRAVASPGLPDRDAKLDASRNAARQTSWASFGVRTLSAAPGRAGNFRTISFPNR